MQAVLNVNFHVARAMLNSVEYLQSILDQAAALSCIAADATVPMQSRTIQEGIWTNLHQLIAEAQKHTKNLEFTLAEEVQLLNS